MFKKIIGRFVQGFALSCLAFTVFGVNTPTPLPAKQVFQPSVQLVDPNNFFIQWTIREGYFLYADRFHITVPPNAPVSLGDIRYPKTLKKIDSLGHKNAVYRNNLVLPIGVLGQQEGSTDLRLQFQGCSDSGFCYPPESYNIHLSLNKQHALITTSIAPANASFAKFNTEQNQSIETLLTSRYTSLALLTFFGLGLLLAFTPCVLPMIPVLSGIIVGHGAISTRKAFGLSLSYVLSMATTYAALGMVVALLGKNLQIAMQTPIVIGTFAGIFVLLALSMFGLFDLKLPVSWQIKLAQTNKSHSNGHYLGAAAMGCLSSLILSPCVTPPLVGVLGYIAKTGNVIFGATALFALGFGMGTPLLVIGTSAGKILPKTGMWMNAVKSLFGFMLLGIAIYLLERILDPTIIMVLWASLCIVGGVYAGAFTRSKSHQEKVSQGFGIILFIYGVLLFMGASIGSTNYLHPLEKFFQQAPIPTTNTTPITIPVVSTVKQLNRALETAQQQRKIIILDFYADWCTSCKVIEKTFAENPSLQQKLHDFSVIKLDITANNPPQQALLNQYQVIAPPTFVFLDQNAKELSGTRLVGELSSDEFLSHLNLIDSQQG